MPTLKTNKKKHGFDLTAVIEKVPEGGYIGFIEEIPGVNTQGETIDEVQENIMDALLLALDYHRGKAEQSLKGREKNIIRERFKFIPA